MRRAQFRKLRGPAAVGSKLNGRRAPHGRQSLRRKRSSESKCPHSERTIPIEWETPPTPTPNEGEHADILPAYRDYGFYVTGSQSTVLMAQPRSAPPPNMYFTFGLNPTRISNLRRSPLASNLTTYFIGVEDNLSHDAIEGWGETTKTS